MIKFIAMMFLFSSISYTTTLDLNVLDFGAVADGNTDNTQAFQAALDRAAEKGLTISIPAGQYRFDGVLTIPDGVALKGVGEGPIAARLDKGTLLLAYAGRDAENSPPFITLQNNGTLKGLSIYYPQQVVEDIRPYPYTVQVRGSRCNIIDVTMVNSYNGIDCGSAATARNYPAQHLPLRLAPWDLHRSYNGHRKDRKCAHTSDLLAGAGSGCGRPG